VNWVNGKLDIDAVCRLSDQRTDFSDHVLVQCHILKN